MAYNFPNERRVIERRRPPRPAYTGPERRLSERREVKFVASKEPMHRGVLWLSVVMVLIVVDSVCLHSTYRHQAFDWLNDTAAGVRNWSDHIWDWGK